MLGVPQQQVQADRAARRDASGATDALSIAQPLWPAVQLFRALCRTQWIWLSSWNGAERRVGLRYEALPVVARMLGVRLKPRLLGQLQVMEDEALREFSAAAAG